MRHVACLKETKTPRFVYSIIARVFVIAASGSSVVSCTNTHVYNDLFAYPSSNGRDLVA